MITWTRSTGPRTTSPRRSTGCRARSPRRAPPSKVEDLHRELVGEISSYGKEIDKAKSAFADGSPKAIVRAQTQLVTAVTRVSGQINRTIDAINERLRE